jgi:cell division protein FtsZ
MENAGSALMGIGVASGEGRAAAAAKSAVSSPLLELSINGAKGVLFAIAGSDDLGMLEVHEAAKIITESVDPNAKIIFGAIKDEKLKKGEVRVTVIATGFPAAGIAPRGTPLFGAFREKEEPAVAPLGKIYNAPLKEKKEEKEEPKKPAPIEIPETKPKAEEDDEWGAVPSFLRRPKIK